MRIVGAALNSLRVLVVILWAAGGQQLRHLHS